MHMHMQVLKTTVLTVWDRNLQLAFYSMLIYGPCAQLVEGSALVAPQLGSPASSDGSTRGPQDAGLLCALWRSAWAALRSP